MRIAFGCTSQVGKDTACEILKEIYGGVRLSFAAPVYSAAAVVQKHLGLPIRKDRNLLIAIGEHARQENPNFWVDLLSQSIMQEEEKNPEVSIFVSDLRMPNEAEALRELGFILVRIIKPDAEIVNHPTDQNADFIHWDHVIENTGTLEEFKQKIVELGNEIQPPNEEEMIRTLKSHISQLRYQKIYEMYEGISKFSVVLLDSFFAVLVENRPKLLQTKVANNLTILASVLINRLSLKEYHDETIRLARVAKFQPSM